MEFLDHVVHFRDPGLEVLDLLLFILLFLDINRSGLQPREPVKLLSRYQVFDVAAGKKEEEKASQFMVRVGRSQKHEEWDLSGPVYSVTSFVLR